MAGYTEHKDDVIRRLRRIEGQVRGVQRMVAEDVYCVDVLTQVSAINAALRSCAVTLLDEHLACCVTEAVARGGDEANTKVVEATRAIARLIRT
ncbi:MULTISPECIES: metal-sensitive transcriptional regulator [Streptomyces]|uniref:Metal-sensitive transcriptional regulator n=1 Tax=Streptomyces katrae TaxID=68223 RepID=A0ABT7H429_9ACTN|nr:MULTISPECIES: metal-sensitive transcriptional regulator [Streptomyces]MDK9499815.1 metal-sensitive transcriptional regulator [Streptomyces katrae]RST00990.1 metal-sensitive transcriptional regulator [Streptomyces sp. WAC07149]GLX22665.1 copper-sensing transcriptional repressor RicR [Streptomyces lavendulae subsp. lavendulae]GLX24193.1 copper-sensing transcriptional repressor RicR [Streptomyces lavendulae subsp. lavendulae]